MALSPSSLVSMIIQSLALLLMMEEGEDHWVMEEEEEGHWMMPGMGKGEGKGGGVKGKFSKNLSMVKIAPRLHMRGSGGAWPTWPNGKYATN